MEYIDMHCDTLMLASFGNKDIYENKDLCIDFKKMIKGGAMAQFFAIFFPEKEYFDEMNLSYMSDQEYFDLLYKTFLDNLAAHQDLIQQAFSAEDIRKNASKGLMSAVLTIEDGRIVNNQMARLKELQELGVRAIALTWNGENCFGYPNSKDEKVMNAGLKPFGKEAVEYMNELGILADCSHLSDGGFWDLVDVSRKPFIATHSNCRAISPHRRNLTDEMIRALAQKGGVMGLNMCPPFLNQDTESHQTTATIALMVEHIKHAVNVGGIDVMALGSDYDGFGGKNELDTCDKYPLLFDALRKAGFTASDIDKITHENVLRVLEC